GPRALTPIAFGGRYLSRLKLLLLLELPLGLEPVVEVCSVLTAASFVDLVRSLRDHVVGDDFAVRLADRRPLRLRGSTRSVRGFCCARHCSLRFQDPSITRLTESASNAERILQSCDVCVWRGIRLHADERVHAGQLLGNFFLGVRRSRSERRPRRSADVADSIERIFQRRDAMQWSEKFCERRDGALQ